MREVKIKPVGPIYCAAAAWLIYSLFGPMYRLSHFLIAAGITVLAYFAGTKIFKTKVIYVEEETPPEPEEKKTVYGEEIDGIIADGERAAAEMTRLGQSINNPALTKKIDELVRITGKIAEDAIHDPSDVPQIRRFLDYFLPTTIKLLHAYDRMSDQGIDGKNITGTMKSIEEMLDTAVEAYRKQLDSLFANQAIDIETDITVMNAMLAREGLAGKGFGTAAQGSA